MAKAGKSGNASLADEIQRRLASALSTINLAMRRAWIRYIAAEHHCYPPEDGRTWIEVSSACAHPACYVCPECQQHFLPRDQT
jgi:hypothetical protein